MNKKYKIIGLGGTFDHFHEGHRAFLKFAASLAEELWVGITTHELIAEKILADEIESFAVRQQAVEKFLTSLHVRFTLFPLHDHFGNTIEENALEAVAVTTATYEGGVRINIKRKERGLPELPLHTCALIHDELGKDFIASSRIRLGEINRDGRVYPHIFQENYFLQVHQKQFFQQPQGRIVLSPTSVSSRKYVVGDIALETFLTHHWPYTLGIIDLQSQRQAYNSPALQFIKVNSETAHVTNSSGVISQELIQELKKLLSLQITNPRHLIVSGEEDLAAVALVLLAPLNSVIYYGQPGEGIVEMTVTEALKEKFYQALT